MTTQQTNRWRQYREILMTIPSYCWLVIFFLIPTLVIFCYSFKPADFRLDISSEWTLDTIKSVFSKNYLVIIWRTIWMSCITTIVCLSLAIPIGFFLAQASRRWQNIILLLIVMPFWSSLLVRIFAWKTLLHPEGILKNVLLFLNIAQPDTVLLYNAGTVLVVMVYSYLPFAILPIYSQAVKFDFHLIEAALDLGANTTKAFFSIFIPGIRRAIFTAWIMVFIPAIGAYVIPDLVGGPQNEVIGTKIAQKVFVDRNLPQASALSTLLSGIICVPIVLQTLFRKVKKTGKEHS